MPDTRPRTFNGKFVADFSQTKLQPEVIAELEHAVQSAALEVIAKLDLAGEVSFRFRDKEWLGIWIDKGEFGPFRELRR